MRPNGVWRDVEVLWAYHDMGHGLGAADVAIGLGSHDLGVATFAAELYHRGLCRRIVFTGANAPTTAATFPRGEAVHYREHALELGVPDEAILVEPRATNTGENVEYSRALLEGTGVGSAILVSRPYQQRRAYATAKKVWPELDVVCASQPVPLEEYVARLGAERVITMLVGDTQRIKIYAERGFAIPQVMPAEVESAYERLVAAGFTGRLAPWPPHRD